MEFMEHLKAIFLAIALIALLDGLRYWPAFRRLLKKIEKRLGVDDDFIRVEPGNNKVGPDDPMVSKALKLE